MILFVTPSGLFLAHDDSIGRRIGKSTSTFSVALPLFLFPRSPNYESAAILDDFARGSVARARSSPPGVPGSHKDQ